MRPQLLENLREYQRAPAEHLLASLRRHGVGFDLSVTGSGKTYIGAAIAAELAVPTLVVAPKIALTAWERASAHFGDSTSRIGWEHLRTGGTQFGFWENGAPPPRSERIFFKCCNCQRKIEPDFIPPCPAHFGGIHCFETKLKPHKYGRFQFHPGIKFIIFDELHRAAGDSLNSEMVIAAKRQGIPTLGLTATLAHSILQMRATGYLARLHELANYDYWCSRLGARRVPMRGIQWMLPQEEKDRVLRELGSQIVPKLGIRITEDQIPDFPARHILPELYDLPQEDTEELNRLYELLAEPLAELEARRMLDVDAEHPLTARLRARQRIELLKVPLAVDLGKEYLEKQNSVVFFVNFQQTIDELLKAFPGAGVINGQITGKARQDVVDAFQRNENRVLIVNNQAGGIALSLQDLLGDYPRVGLVFPTDSPVVMQQLFGRLARAGGKSPVLYRVIFASRSVEVKMRRELEIKYCNLDAVNGVQK